ncbi:cysteine proteinase [Fistulina hepatica ATCC 64428]|uniref:Cysteine proteinase n=1 Tax=Fistulina hepatica ATCC 64428 TaxID=1128425 RepID=A0A0D7AIF8_9AGAR|nr:cysteine proteinase [Fistulina hepatica ATCC 64428]
MTLKYRLKDEEIDRRLRKPPLPTSLPPAIEREVEETLRRRSGLISKYAREQVMVEDIQRLRPGQWLNDEIINFYGALILGRSESGQENQNPRSKGVPGKNILDVHYFSSFFWSKLTDSGYQAGRLAKWTKKFDIFAKDAVLIPVNHSNFHWTSACINFRRKRIESYDSMGMPRKHVFTHLREYLDAEHRNKKKKPFDFTGWEDCSRMCNNYSMQDIPQQENGFDCGVFTCQFLEALSRGEEQFSFTQEDMPYLRRRMVWEILHARLRDEP